jgi:excisionase family DNA binding protein
VLEIGEKDYCILLLVHSIPSMIDLRFSVPIGQVLLEGNKDVLEDRWLSVHEIAEYLGIKRDTVYKWIDRHEMPAHKVGRLWKFRKEEIDKWVRRSSLQELVESPHPIQAINNGT